MRTMRRRDLVLAGLGLAGGLSAGQVWGQAKPAKRILVWSEGTAPKSVYPNDINGAVAEGLAGLRGYDIRTAGLDDPEQGVADAVLRETDVLFWWGHQKHGQVTDENVARIVRRVKEDGMGVVFLHSAHFSKPLKAVLNATGAWSSYVNDGQPQDVSVLLPNHPIARGVRPFIVPKEERYEEPFEVPQPEAVVFDAFYESTKTRARQGLCWTIGKGRVFYLRLGHEEFPVYFMPEVRRILRNAALWTARDEAAIAEDADPFAPAARAVREPTLAVIAQNAGYGGTDITAGGEVAAQRFVRAAAGKVRFTPLAAYGTEKVCHAGWYEATLPANGANVVTAPKRSELWKLSANHNKQMNPPVERGGKTEFDPGDKSFGLWVASESFQGETIYTEDVLQTLIIRFKANDRHKAHIYKAVRSDGTPVPNTVLIGFEYSTNNDNQEIVALVENVRAAA